MAAVNVMSQMKLPAWGVALKQMGNTTPIDVISFVAAGAFLAYVVSCNDAAKVRKRR